MAEPADRGQRADCCCAQAGRQVTRGAGTPQRTERDRADETETRREWTERDRTDEAEARRTGDDRTDAPEACRQRPSAGWRDHGTAERESCTCSRESASERTRTDESDRRALGESAERERTHESSPGERPERDDSCTVPKCERTERGAAERSACSCEWTRTTVEPTGCKRAQRRAGERGAQPCEWTRVAIEFAGCQWTQCGAGERGAYSCEWTRDAVEPASRARQTGRGTREVTERTTQRAAIESTVVASAACQAAEHSAAIAATDADGIEISATVRRRCEERPDGDRHRVAVRRHRFDGHDTTTGDRVDAGGARRRDRRDRATAECSAATAAGQT